MDILFLVSAEKNWEARLILAESIIGNPITVVYGEDTILKSFIKCFNVASTHSFVLIDGDNLLLPEAKNVLLSHSGEPTIFNASNKYGLNYPHGGIKVLSKSMLNNPIFGQTSILDITTKLNLKHDPRTLSIHDFSFSEFNEWKTIYKELIKLHFTYINSKHTHETLLNWLKTDYVKMIYAQVKNDIIENATLSNMSKMASNTVLKKQFLKHKKIILAAICKNEILHVDRFVENIKYFDKCIILDTGSTDGTYEKLKTIDNVIVFQEHISDIDFSKFRNNLLQKINETVKCDAICYIDLDEVLTLKDIDLLKEEVFINNGDIKRFSIFRIEDDKNNHTTQARIFKNDPGKWVHKLHEDFIFDDNCNTALALNRNIITIDHVSLKTDIEVKEKLNTYLDIIQRFVEDDPEHYLYFLFLHYIQNKEYNNIINLFNDKKNIIKYETFNKFTELIYSHTLKAQSQLGHLLDQNLVDYLRNLKNKSAHIRLIHCMLNHRSIDYLEHVKILFEEFNLLSDNQPNENYLASAYDENIILKIKNRLGLINI